MEFDMPKMEFDLPRDVNSIIKVIGVGGGGSNAVNHMYNQGIHGVDFIVCNTDRQALDISPVPFKIQLGPNLTEGRGAGMLPEVGMNAAIENIEEIRELLSKNTKMVFVTAGMGGGTGTGAAPVIAGIARELGILTVGIVTVPFGFEGRKRRQQAELGLEEMRKAVDTLLVINNEKLREMTGNLTINNAFSKADDVLTVAAKGIAELISVTGAVNVDFNDVYTVMKDSGVAIMGSAAVEGEDRAIRCVTEALDSPLLNDNNIAGAKFVLLNITYGDKEVLMDEITEITDFIQDEAGSSADVIWGHGYDPTLGEKLSVTLIATGFNSSPITGFEKAPEKIVRPLHEEPKNEIVSQLGKPTEVAPKAEPTKNVENNNELFLKTVEPTLEAKPTIRNWVEEAPKTIVEPQKEQEPVSLVWEVESTSPKVEEEIIPVIEVKAPSEEKIVHTLELDDAIIPLENTIRATPKTHMSPEEQLKIQQERMERLHAYTQKLKKADGLTQLEKEPAFERRNIQLDHSKPSVENSVSRYGVSGNGENISLRSNNSFLHDNVD